MQESRHYKSWSGLSKWLQASLCDELQGRITYFLTRYHKVHDSYGRAAILLDGRELVCFSWIAACRQEADVTALSREKPDLPGPALYAALEDQWSRAGTRCDMEFLSAALAFRSLSIADALASEDYIVKILAILDRRVGRRTLQRIADAGDYRAYPPWVRQFYALRLAEAHLDP